MGVLTQDMRDILASAMLAFVATVTRDGSPSLSPKADLARSYGVSHATISRLQA